MMWKTVAKCVVSMGAGFALMVGEGCKKQAAPVPAQPAMRVPGVRPQLLVGSLPVGSLGPYGPPKVERVVHQLQIALEDARRGRPDSPVHALLESVLRGPDTVQAGMVITAPRTLLPADSLDEYQRFIATRWIEAGESLGYLPGAHEPDCPVFARILEFSPPRARASAHSSLST